MSSASTSAPRSSLHESTPSSARFAVFYIQGWQIVTFCNPFDSDVVQGPFHASQPTNIVPSQRCMITCVDHAEVWDPLQIIRDIEFLSSSQALEQGTSYKNLTDLSVVDLMWQKCPMEVWERIPEPIHRWLREGAVLSSSKKKNLHLEPLGQLLQNTGSSSAQANRYAVSPSLSCYYSPVSHYGSPASFVTARSVLGSPGYVLSTTSNAVAVFHAIQKETPSIPKALANLKADYETGLSNQKIVVPFDKEINWSGKGQHVTFTAAEEPPLVMVSHLATSLTAAVEKVLCRGIAFARKSMRCSRSLTITDALQEVKHLQNLQHHHIVQLVGSYLCGRNFNILMYPVADCDLGRFLQDTSDLPMLEKECHKTFLAGAMSCLASALSYVHNRTTKHMDIKPKNILVRRNEAVRSGRYTWKVYLADFGLSKSFAEQGHSQTDGPVSRTPRYCAPEVYAFEPRGRASDIFSLGCVYLEMLTVLDDRDLDELSDCCRGEGMEDAYHASMDDVRDWLKRLAYPEQAVISLVEKMLHCEPAERPKAQDLVDTFFCRDQAEYWRGTIICCDRRPESFVYTCKDGVSQVP